MDSLWFETVIKRWQRDCIIERVLTAKIVPWGDDNEGYVSQIWFVTLEVILRSGAKTAKRFVVKQTPSDEFTKALAAKCFQQEIATYSGLLRSMENLMETSNDHGGRIWPRFYGHCKNNHIIFNDLTAKGYELINRRKLADLDVSSLVLNCLGRYHAMGLILLHRNEVQISESGSFLLMVGDILSWFSINSLEELATEILASWGSEWKEIGRKITTLNKRIPGLLKEILNPKLSPLNVINHGDVKPTNLVVKRDYQGRPVKCKFLDFQFPNYNTFATDLHFFLMNSVVPEMRRNNRDQLLKTYYSGLTATLKLYQYPMDTIPTFSEIKDEMKRTSLIGFLLIPLATGMTSEIQDKLIMRDGVSPCDPANYRTDKFKEYFCEDIKNFINNGSI